MAQQSPLLFIWQGDGFTPVPRHAKACDERYVVGERYLLEETQERDMVKHRRQFAFVREAWENLPECYALEPWAQSSEHLRKFSLIKCGYCHTETFPCGSKAEAQRWAPRLRAADTYAIVTVAGTVVHRFTAESQSVRAMGAKRFEESRRAIMAFVDGLLKVEPGATQKTALTAVS